MAVAERAPQPVAGRIAVVGVCAAGKSTLVAQLVRLGYDARIDAVLEETYDLFLDLASHDSHLEFPIYYCVSRDGKAWTELPDDPTLPGDLTPLFAEWVYAQ